MESKMGTINHLFDPGQDVYVIATCDAGAIENVQPGTVIRVRGTALTTGTTVVYDIQVGGSGTSEFDEDDVFVDKAAAMTEYAIRVD